jgi:hypothetical protein
VEKIKKLPVFKLKCRSNKLKLLEKQLKCNSNLKLPRGQSIHFQLEDMPLLNASLSQTQVMEVDRLHNRPILVCHHKVSIQVAHHKVNILEVLLKASTHHKVNIHLKDHHKVSHLNNTQVMVPNSREVMVNSHHNMVNSQDMDSNQVAMVNHNQVATASQLVMDNNLNMVNNQVMVNNQDMVNSPDMVNNQDMVKNLHMVSNLVMVSHSQVAMGNHNLVAMASLLLMGSNLVVMVNHNLVAMANLLHMGSSNLDIMVSSNKDIVTVTVVIKCSG